MPGMRVQLINAWRRRDRRCQLYRNKLKQKAELQQLDEELARFGCPALYAPSVDLLEVEVGMEMLVRLGG